MPASSAEAELLGDEFLHLVEGTPTRQGVADHAGDEGSQVNAGVARDTLVDDLMAGKKEDSCAIADLVILGAIQLCHLLVVRERREISGTVFFREESAEEVAAGICFEDGRSVEWGAEATGENAEVRLSQKVASSVSLSDESTPKQGALIYDFLEG